MNLPLHHIIRHSNVYRLIFFLGVLFLLSTVVWVVAALQFQKSLNAESLIALNVRFPLAVAVFNFLIGFALMAWLVLTFVKKPIDQLIDEIQHAQDGEASKWIDADPNNEFGKLASATSKVRRALTDKQAALNKQRDEYQSLFELVPCLITVQDREYKLLKYNQEFSESFTPNPGDYCYQAYKGSDKKCEDCPVEKTFKDGRSHYSEETGIDKDGTTTHWILKTTPIKDASGEVVAAMEISLDVTHKKQLEELLAESTKKYHIIFNNIPNSVFILDCVTFEIFDCNDSAAVVYGYTKEEFKQQSFLDLFREQEREAIANQLKTSSNINQVAQVGKNHKHLVVNVHIALSEYMGRRAMLVTTNDITQRLVAEQQLIQASKMATLGEMATGIAHELNQPLSVIKTSSSFFLKKFHKNEPIDSETLRVLLRKVDGNVDRATNIINHMRQFARKSDITLEKVQINDVLKSAFEIFSQQLKVRGIEVIWELDDRLPKVLTDPGRLEQVFINLLLNARDAIEDKRTGQVRFDSKMMITIRSFCDNQRLTVEVRDTGTGFQKEIADKLFEPFFTTKEVGNGTGLGLSISYGIVKDCGGEIKAVSHGDQGASFVVTFSVPD